MNLNTSVEAFEKYIFYSLDGCWYWTGGVQSKGYGHFRGQNAHRASYYLYKGTDPKTLNVCHSCDNKLCVNPDHLWLGTHADNVMDKVRKGRQSRGRKHKESVTFAAHSNLKPIMGKVMGNSVEVIKFVGFRVTPYKTYSTWLVHCKNCGFEEIIDCRKIRRRQSKFCKNCET